ncbi:hypothetical protein [Bufonid herpesvirus 1]|uniref:hypothetical protein n=1 Tax=Bufonid herpesvirus 1 TaxID=2282206 RepID=UPI000EB6F840|nr:hypothetical protein [Bufonid herpesvirus 1]AXF48567.1 hypothetical protein [Bufonid herpesvirus 1]
MGIFFSKDNTDYTLCTATFTDAVNNARLCLKARGVDQPSGVLTLNAACVSHIAVIKKDTVAVYKINKHRFIQDLSSNNLNWSDYKPKPVIKSI